MKITALIENTTKKEELFAEHGLSLFIETDSHRILFDMGQGSLFAKNAETLGIDLASTDLAILSHGHYDHGGGLSRFLEINTSASVYIHRDAFLPHYHGAEKYIGLDPTLKEHPRIVFTDDTHRIDEHLTLFSCNKNTRSHRFDTPELTVLTDGTFLPDDFRHEQYLLIEENGKRVLISGCSHKGILDITSWFAPEAIVGGFHFSKLALDDALSDAAKELNAFPTTFYTCHCTGTEQFEFMKGSMDRLFYLSSGESIII